MKTIIPFLSLLGLFSSLISANIETSCNCIDDVCIDAQGSPPLNTSCLVPVINDANDTESSDTGYAYQACGNGSFADLSGVDIVQVHANTSNCIQLLEDLSDLSFVFLSSQLYNTSAVSILSVNDCYLWALGGANATEELTDVNETFFVGNMDFAFALGNSIISYGKDNGGNSNMSVCGTIPNCGLYSLVTHTGSTPAAAPDFAWCLGGEYIAAHWIESGGSYSQDMVNFEDLPSEQRRMSHAIRSQAAVPEPTEGIPTENDSSGLIDRSDLESRSKNWFLRCDVGDRSLAECTTQYDTFCDEDGRLHSDDVTCRFDCSCMPMPRAHCGLNYGFIYDCYHEEVEDKVYAHNSSTTKESATRWEDE